MIKLQPINQLLEQLNVPSQDLAQLSFCDGDRESSVKAWVRSLPLTQIQFVSGLLYQALPDVSRFQTSAGNRIKILEILRNPSMQAAQGLSQSFLNQPLILPDAAIKTATIVQALQKHLVNGYLVAIRDLCKNNNIETELLSLAIHRAITGLGVLLLRYYQLYLPIPPQLWTELHSLYQIALNLELCDIVVQDRFPHHQHTYSISLAYIRVLLLACARPNQLRQEEIIATYEALDKLTSLAQLQEASDNSPNNLFAVALNGERPPLYRSRFNSQEQEVLLELNTSQLCQKLKDVADTSNPEASDDGLSLRNELHLTPALTSHLLQAWNLLAQRHFERKQAHGFLEVTVGITNIHYHLSGGTIFTHFLNQLSGTAQPDNIGSIFQKRGAQLKEAPKKRNDDPWGDTFDIAGTSLAGKPLSTSNIEFSIRQQEDSKYKEKEKEAHPVHKVPLIDTSPGGYCLEWRSEIPSQVKAGELLGLREPSRQRWSLGVVRWANQTKGATQLGIQLLSAQVVPVGLAIIHKTGANSEYLRAFEIPALKAINQPATMITNAISFREYSKARVHRRSTDANQNGSQLNIQLLRRMFATGAFSQFTYRELANANAVKEGAKEKPDDFDSVWDS